MGDRRVARPHVLLPARLPRACFWPGPHTTSEDRQRWFGGIDARMVIAVESAWLERIRSTRLYRYVLPQDGFELRDATAGRWVGRAAVAPLVVEPVGDLLAALADAGVELRITPALTDLSPRVIASTLEFSGTRLRNAQGWLATSKNPMPNAH